MVEISEFGGTFSLGLVTAARKAILDHSTSLEVFKANGYVKRLDSNFVRFAAPLLAAPPKDGLEQFEVVKLLQKFEETARTILKQSIRNLEDAVAKKQAFGPTIPALSSTKLLYESDIACKVFGPRPTSEEMYATHLYLYSYADKFGRDPQYRPNHVANGVATSPVIGAGPYFFRSEEDKELVRKVTHLMEIDSPKVKRFRSALEAALLDRLTGKSDISLSLAEFDEPFLQLIEKACLCSWQDSTPNPLVETMKTLIGNRAPISTMTEMTSFARLIGLGVRLLDQDLAKTQSGLQFSNVAYSHDDLKKFPGIVAEDASIFTGRTQFDELAIAIDSESTIEVDDAISVQRVGADTWLHVHVADPTRICSFDSIEDLQARSLASTLYLPEGNFLMLPLKIGLQASLDPMRKYNGTMTFSAKLDSNGDIIDYSVNLGVITNFKRITFEQCDELLQCQIKGDSLSREGDSLKKIQELIEAHRSFRKKKGLVELNIPQGKIAVSTDRMEFKLDGMWETESKVLVSECMIIAGRVAAMFAEERKLAIPYRYHMNPSLYSGKEFDQLFDQVKESGHNVSLFDWIRLLSYFRPSAVDILPREHWGLGLYSYCKATSPLRRYSDLLLHHQIRLSLDGHSKTLSAEQMSQIIPPVYRHEQYLNRLEKLSKRFWTLRYMDELIKHHHDSRSQRKPFPVTVLPLDYRTDDRSLQVYLEDFALRQFCKVPGGSQLEIGVPTQMELIAVDPIRQHIELRLPA